MQSAGFVHQPGSGRCRANRRWRRRMLHRARARAAALDRDRPQPHPLDLLDRRQHATPKDEPVPRVMPRRFLAHMHQLARQFLLGGDPLPQAPSTRWRQRERLASGPRPDGHQPQRLVHLQLADAAARAGDRVPEDDDGRPVVGDAPRARGIVPEARQRGAAGGEPSRAHHDAEPVVHRPGDGVARAAAQRVVWLAGQQRPPE